MADVILPELPEDEEYVIRKKPKTQLQLLREQRDSLQSELAQWTAPSNEELKELGRLSHPYSRMESELDMVKEQIKAITG